MLLALRAAQKRPTSGFDCPIFANVRRAYSSAPLVAFDRDSEMHRRAPDPEKMKLAKRVGMGMDEDKFVDYKWWIPGWSNAWEENRIPMSGYQRIIDHATPYHNTMTIEECQLNYTLEDWYDHYPVSVALKQAYKVTCYPFYCAVYMSIAVFLFTMAIRYENAREPMEMWMDREQFFNDYWWSYHGHKFDHHLYQAWLEKRRARKWRGIEFDDVNHGRTPAEVEHWVHEKHAKMGHH